ncbi:MAG: SurA N-terminal domain-containing protein [Desulfobulbaceae bacterium]|nr:SurA N-terminal domain-containing protein [Desulfobulbaceae bacterium]
MKFLCQILLFLFAFPVFTQTSYGDIVDRVVAVVNEDIITLSEVNAEGKHLFQRVAEQAPASELPEALKQVRRTVIDKLIENKIMHQEAEKANITVSEEDIERAFELILKKNNTTPQQFRIQLASMGMTEEQYRENLKIQVLSSKLVSYEVRSKVIIPESRIIDYYDSHYTERVGEGGFYLLQIGISWDQNGDKNGLSKNEAREKAEHIRSLAAGGNDFRELAREHSNLPSAVDGGDIGVINREDLSEEMLKIISETKPGDISTIIETSSGYQFFKVLSSQEGQIITKIPYAAVKDDIYEILYQQEIEVRFEDWLNTKKSQSYIKVL